ncbi:hypothetical protein LTR17_023054 [Elasticomyces elasticus]|nr:hypothetical protein LTR17_023054 [Elasticomyces elasticus]
MVKDSPPEVTTRHPQAARLNFENAGMATLWPGNRGRYVQVHMPLLCSSSAALDRWFAPPGRKSKEPQPILADVPIQLLNTYVDWLYRRRLTTKHEETLECAHARSEIREDDEYCELAMLYRLGRLLEDSNFCNAVIDACIEKLADVPCVGVSTLPGCHCIELIYGKPEYPDDMAKKAVIDAFVESGRSVHFDGMAEHVPERFARDLTRALLASRGRGSSGAAEQGDQPCKYHDHFGIAECEGERSRKRRRMSQ